MDYVFAHGAWWRHGGTSSAPGWTGLSAADAYRLGLPAAAPEETRMQVGEAPASSPAPPAPAAPAPATAPLLTADGLPRIGPGAGPAGLDVGMPPALAAAIVYAWRTQEDPQALRQLATTMLEGSYRIAADVLLARAAAKPHAPTPAPSSSSSSSSGGARALGIVAAAVGIVAGLASLRGERS